MDYVFVLFVTVATLRGARKGGFRIIFSIVSLILAGSAAYLLCSHGANLLEKTNLFGKILPSFFENKLNGFSDATFSNFDEMISCLQSKKYGAFFVYFAEKLFPNADFSENSTLGSCFSKPICNFIEKIVSFLVIFIAALILLRIVEKIFGKVFDLFRLRKINRFVGAGVGFAHGVLSFLVFFVILSAVANISLNQKLIEFSQSGIVSSFIYNLQIEKAISIFI